MPGSGTTYHIDFDDWVRLARTDPARFEHLRDRVLDYSIARAPADRQERLRRLQWRVNQVRNTASNPLSACIAISNMMWSSFNHLGEAYDDLQHARRPFRRCARILPFPEQPPRSKV
ncbi:DUF3135 domain-containing protein [Thiohalophilus thiocyanatoxydans]|uniref:Uncharacterized protein DUF3135 n=1 Tax=Thiohalophilus thiocyanatoxydans TaxID=381308 RepID=A0A4R8J199_9GAMM|nr:DUF3135 domain-containing protein [Thiohalophilus thiocyanatoxydans]TDY03949.1 uncharacterized protein DUF3135 [Thiohalophilus thiocyanatoxydans]